MEIKTLKSGISVKKNGGKMDIEIVPGVHSEYSDVLHFYFPPGVEVIQYGEQHFVVRLKKGVAETTC